MVQKSVFVAAIAISAAALVTAVVSLTADSSSDALTGVVSSPTEGGMRRSPRTMCDGWWCRRNCEGAAADLSDVVFRGADRFLPVRR